MGKFKHESQQSEADISKNLDPKKLTVQELKQHLARMNVTMSSARNNKEYYVNLFNENINDYINKNKAANVAFLENSASDSKSKKLGFIENITKRKRKRDQEDDASLAEERDTPSKYILRIISFLNFKKINISKFIKLF